MSVEEMEQAIREVAARFRVRAAALTTYNPERDEDEKTLGIVMRVVDAMAACALS
jgi:arginase family enzyme